MDTINKNKLRILFVDILKGYSIAYYKNNKLYFKHNTSLDSGDIDHFKEEFIQKAKKNGLPTEDQKEEYIIKEKLWSVEKNEEIKKIKSYISNLKQTKSKLFKNDDIANINKQINEEIEILKLKETEMKVNQLMQIVADTKEDDVEYGGIVNNNVITKVLEKKLKKVYKMGLNIINGQIHIINDVQK